MTTDCRGYELSTASPDAASAESTMSCIFWSGFVFLKNPIMIKFYLIYH